MLPTENPCCSTLPRVFVLFDFAGFRPVSLCPRCFCPWCRSWHIRASATIVLIVVSSYACGVPVGGGVGIKMKPFFFQVLRGYLYVKRVEHYQGVPLSVHD